MLAAGAAYRCYATPGGARGDAREGARARAARGSTTGAGATAIRAEAPPGVKPVIRLKAPLTGETVIEDQVQGRVVWQNENLDDFVLLRSDGTPTYMLAVVVDDHDMGVTHIIRGDDHLTNAARQKQIYDALGWPVPVMAHIPLIHGPDGAKLSKRHGALGVEAYRAMGYLPAAMRNYLVRLGWSHGDQEIFSTEEIDRGVRSAADRPLAGAASISPSSTASTATTSARRSDADLLAEIERVLPHIAGGAELAAKLTPELRQQAAGRHAGAEGARQDAGRTDRRRSLSVVADRPLALDDKAAGILTAEARALLRELAERARRARAWDAGATEQAVRAFAERKGTKLGSVAQPLRAALTGRTTSPPIFDVLAVLGRDESLARLRDQI